MKIFRCYQQAEDAQQMELRVFLGPAGAGQFSKELNALNPRSATAQLLVAVLGDHQAQEVDALTEAMGRQ